MTKIYVALDDTRNKIIGEFKSEKERADAVFEYYSHLVDPFEIEFEIGESTFLFETTEEEIGEL